MHTLRKFYTIWLLVVVLFTTLTAAFTAEPPKGSHAARLGDDGKVTPLPPKPTVEELQQTIAKKDAYINVLEATVVELQKKLQAVSDFWTSDSRLVQLNGTLNKLATDAKSDVKSDAKPVPPPAPPAPPAPASSK